MITAFTDRSDRRGFTLVELLVVRALVLVVSRATVRAY
jgi:prepilin-type N-terminal cleavage/methylation domain-containing protein